MRVQQHRPANDNGGQPCAWPIFDSLMDRHDLTLVDLLLYGVLVAYLGRGENPSLKELAAAMRYRDTNTVRLRLRRLEDRGLLRSHYAGGPAVRVRYTLLGPTCTGKAA